MHTDRAAAVLTAAADILTAAGIDLAPLLALLVIDGDDPYGVRGDDAIRRASRTLFRAADRLTSTRVRDHGRRGHTISVPYVRPATADTGDALYRVATDLDLIRCNAAPLTYAA